MTDFQLRFLLFKQEKEDVNLKTLPILQFYFDNLIRFYEDKREIGL